MRCSRCLFAPVALGVTPRLLGSDRDRLREFENILARSRSSDMPTGGSSSSNRFDGNFQGGSPFLDPNMFKDMQSVVSSGLTPDLREMMQAAIDNPGPMMGMMAFGVGENEKGKKVARAAKLSYDLKTGKVNKDFSEQQLEPDDPSLPRETVEDYSTEGAIEVEFVEDRKQVGHTDRIAAEDISVESADSSNEKK